MISSIISRVVILLFGTLYPAYASYKAVRTKNLKEYVKWMMYWIVFALFTCAETFTDVFLSWFPFYYEIKIVLVVWLLSPATKGSSFLYRKFVHPALSRREQEIDDAIAKAKDQGYHTVLNLGSKGVNYATAVIMQTAIRGGGGLVQQLRKSYSLSDLTEAPHAQSHDAPDEASDVLAEQRLVRRTVARSGYNTRRSASESSSKSSLIFSELDVDLEVRNTRSSARGDVQDFSHVKSSEDISSGYSSAENSAATLARTGSLGSGAGAAGAAAGRPRTRATHLAARAAVTNVKRPAAAEGSEVIIEELQDNENLDFTDLPPLLNLPATYHISQTNPPFLFEYVGNQIRIIQILGDVSQNYVGMNNRNIEEILMSQGERLIDECKPNKIEEIDESCGQLIDQKCKTIPETSQKTVPNIIIPSYEEEINGNLEKEDMVNDDQDDPSNLYINNCVQGDKLPLKENTIQTFEGSETSIVYNSSLTAEHKQSCSISSSSASLNSAKTSPSAGKDESGDVESIGSYSFNEDTMETDDEASYGTPDDSPKIKKKREKGGKYGKSKAPPPPDIKMHLIAIDGQQPLETHSNFFESAGVVEVLSKDDSHTELQPFTDPLLRKDIYEPDQFQIAKPLDASSSHAVTSKRKFRHKSKSPIGRKIKTGSSPISRLMQLPGKLAFWHKTDDKLKANACSTSSDEDSHKSSNAEKKADDFQSCLDLREAIDKAKVDDSGLAPDIPTITVSASMDTNVECVSTNTLLTDIDLEESVIAKDIIDKSDALQKLIEAKRESHPEYKIIPLHDEEISTTSKSTEV